MDTCYYESKLHIVMNNIALDTVVEQDPICILRSTMLLKGLSLQLNYPPLFYCNSYIITGCYLQRIFIMLRKQIMNVPLIEITGAFFFKKKEK